MSHFLQKFHKKFSSGTKTRTLTLIMSSSQKTYCVVVVVDKNKMQNSIFPLYSLTYAVENANLLVISVFEQKSLGKNVVFQKVEYCCRKRKKEKRSLFFVLWNKSRTVASRCLSNVDGEELLEGIPFFWKRLLSICSSLQMTVCEEVCGSDWQLRPLSTEQLLLQQNWEEGQSFLPYCVARFS